MAVMVMASGLPSFSQNSPDFVQPSALSVASALAGSYGYAFSSAGSYPVMPFDSGVLLTGWAPASASWSTPFLSTA